MTLTEKLEKANATIQVLTKLLIETNEELRILKNEHQPKNGKQIFLNVNFKKQQKS